MLPIPEIQNNGMGTLTLCEIRAHETSAGNIFTLKLTPGVPATALSEV